MPPRRPAARPHAVFQEPSPALHRYDLDPRRPAEEESAAPRPLSAARANSGPPLTQQLADVWCALLGVSHVEEYDHFFDLGGANMGPLTLDLGDREAVLLQGRFQSEPRF